MKFMLVVGQRLRLRLLCIVLTCTAASASAGASVWRSRSAPRPSASIAREVCVTSGTATLAAADGAAEG